MSDNFLRFVPTDPEVLPDLASTAGARDMVAERLPRADAVEVGRFNSVEFIDCGGNFESVRCRRAEPICCPTGFGRDSWIKPGIPE